MKAIVDNMGIVGNNQAALLGLVAIITILHLHLIGNDPKARILPKKMFWSYFVQLIILLALMMHNVPKQ